MQNYNQRDDTSRKRKYQVILVGWVCRKAGLDALKRISYFSRWTFVQPPSLSLYRLTIRGSHIAGTKYFA
jgi:hypothetical protein